MRTLLQGRAGDGTLLELRAWRTSDGRVFLRTDGPGLVETLEVADATQIAPRVERALQPRASLPIEWDDPVAPRAPDRTGLWATPEQFDDWWLDKGWGSEVGLAERDGAGKMHGPPVPLGYWLGGCAPEDTDRPHRARRVVRQLALGADDRVAAALRRLEAAPRHTLVKLRCGGPNWCYRRDQRDSWTWVQDAAARSAMIAGVAAPAAGFPESVGRAARGLLDPIELFLPEVRPTQLSCAVDSGGATAAPGDVLAPEELWRLPLGAVAARPHSPLAGAYVMREDGIVDLLGSAGRVTELRGFDPSGSVVVRTGRRLRESAEASLSAAGYEVEGDYARTPLTDLRPGMVVRTCDAPACSLLCPVEGFDEDGDDEDGDDDDDGFGFAYLRGDATAVRMDDEGELHAAGYEDFPRLAGDPAACFVVVALDLASEEEAQAAARRASPLVWGPADDGDLAVDDLDDGDLAIDARGLVLLREDGPFRRLAPGGGEEIREDAEPITRIAAGIPDRCGTGDLRGWALGRDLPRRRLSEVLANQVRVPWSRTRSGDLCLDAGGEAALRLPNGYGLRLLCHPPYEVNPDGDELWRIVARDVGACSRGRAEELLAASRADGGRPVALLAASLAEAGQATTWSRAPCDSLLMHSAFGVAYIRPDGSAAPVVGGLVGSDARLAPEDGWTVLTRGASALLGSLGRFGAGGSDHPHKDEILSRAQAAGRLRPAPRSSPGSLEDALARQAEAAIGGDLVAQVERALATERETLISLPDLPYSTLGVRLEVRSGSIERLRPTCRCDVCRLAEDGGETVRAVAGDRLLQALSLVCSSHAVAGLLLPWADVQATAALTAAEFRPALAARSLPRGLGLAGKLAGGRAAAGARRLELGVLAVVEVAPWLWELRVRLAARDLAANLRAEQLLAHASGRRVLALSAPLAARELLAGAARPRLGGPLGPPSIEAGSILGADESRGLRPYRTDLIYEVAPGESAIILPNGSALKLTCSGDRPTMVAVRILDRGEPAAMRREVAAARTQRELAGKAQGSRAMVVVVMAAEADGSSPTRGTLLA
jgi:hypothetical protein